MSLPPLPEKCECDYDPAYHRERNAYLGKPGDGCHNAPADHGNVRSSPALCMSCLFGCAE